MKNWLRDRPWIWLVIWLGAVLVASAVTVFLAEANKPEVIRQRSERPPRALGDASPVAAQVAPPADGRREHQEDGA